MNSTTFQMIKAVIKISRQEISDKKQTGELRRIWMMHFAIVDTLL